MPKAADLYFRQADFAIVEEGFDPAHSLMAESIFSLANEYMGVRGYIDEGLGEQSMRGSYLNGVYELEGENTPGGYKGIVKQTHYMVTCADMFGTAFDCPDMRLVDFSRSLDLRSGLLSRKTVYKTPQGRLQLTAERLLSMEQKELAAQRLVLESDSPMAFSLALGVDATVPHRTTGRSQWRMLEQGPSAMTLQTHTTGQRLAYAYRLNQPGGQMRQAHRVHNEEKKLLAILEVSLKPRKPLILEKICAVLREGDLASAQACVAQAPNFDGLLASNRTHYDAFWAVNDVEIGGDPLNQQGIRFCLFQLHQTYRGAVPGSNIGAKGLTGEAYNGHAFWDTEAYCLSHYLLTDPKAAKNLLLYRYRTLPQALERAKELDLQGACYPIATLNGKEACTLWQHASLQMQPSTAVAYGIQQYARFTGDEAFLYGEGARMLAQIARYCASRGDWNQSRTGFGYYGVMGPDEFHLMVNNNFYTNYMGKKTLLFAADTLEGMPREALEQLGVSREELALWRECAHKMILDQREDGVFSQHEGYFSLPRLDIRRIPRDQFPLYHHWSYDRIYRTDMIKQPDVLMALFLYPHEFTARELAANYDYYEPRCIHESSLSPSVHSVIASWLSRPQEAYRFFGFATRLDLDNYNNNTGEGLHITSLAAAWITILYGFGGLKIDGNSVSLSPALPPHWTHLTFCLNLGRGVVRVRVTHEGVDLSLVSGQPVEVKVHGEAVRVR